MERLTEKVETGFQCNDRECRLSYCDRGCGHYQLMINKLADYEDAEEQGLLLRLPCKVGSTVYQPIMGSHVQEVIVVGLCFDIVRNVWLYEIAFEYNNGEWIKTVCEFAYIGVTVFLTREEAEVALKQMGE